MNMHIAPSIKAEMHNSNCSMLEISLLFEKQQLLLKTSIAVIARAMKTNHHIFILNCNKGIKKQMPIKNKKVK